MKRSKFSLSYTHLSSFDMGELVPVGLVEVNPGDSFRHSASALVRCAPMLAPVMHPVDVRIHHWFVPHRLVWDNWENFITGGPDGLNASVFPTITTPGGGYAVGSLADYLGVTPSVAGVALSALPFRGYALIWNEWYRDQDLQTRLTVSTADGADTTTSTVLQTCAWEKDYYTSARPWEQKGPTVSLPLGTVAPVKGIGAAGSIAAGGGAAVRETTPLPNRTYANGAVSANPGIIFETDGAGGTNTKPLIFADLSSATSVTVNTLRQSLAIQRYEEAAARYGSRYTEYLARLGVRSSDARLQRPEYLGGGRQRIQFSEVLQTGPGTDPVGDLKGHGIAALRSNRYKRFFEEHGYVFTFMSIRPKTIYANGLKRHWNRRTKFDYWQRELEHIGQQPVLNKEVYMAHATPDGTFGYQDRYDEYRRQESLISGEFRSTLNFWHFARIFGSTPALNSAFVSCVPSEVPFAVPAEDAVQVQVFHSLQARRLLSKTGHSFIF